jgi:hypothetical protein
MPHSRFNNADANAQRTHLAKNQALRRQPSAEHMRAAFHQLAWLCEDQPRLRRNLFQFQSGRLWISSGASIPPHTYMVCSIVVFAMSASPPGARNDARKCYKHWPSFLIVGIASSILISCFSIAGHGEKEIRYEMSHRFSVEDPQFLRSMGELLGPAILPGNQVTALQNGD